MSDDFFGDLGKSITNATKRAVGRTGNLIESTKINAMITGEVKSIEKLQMELGALYYEKYLSGSVDPAEEFLPILDELTDHKEKVAGYRTELAEVKGMKVCPGCGEIIEMSAVFCPKCGSSAVDGKAGKNSEEEDEEIFFEEEETEEVLIEEESEESLAEEEKEAIAAEDDAEAEETAEAEEETEDGEEK